MKQTMLFIDILFFAVVMFLYMGCTTQIQAASKPAFVDQQINKIDPADVEVIKSLDLLQNWDMIGPQGPDLKKLNDLHAQTTLGVNHAK